jgi:DNA mismatch repair protein MutL
MSAIAVLPDILINKIAAGEVIERPASVVRELIDNAVDARSTQIDIEILHGGKKLIKVSDNGDGMIRDDALLCFERHATSKIASEDDLFDISTLGFRGEALPAIASVSKITLITAPADANAGTRVEIGTNNKRDVSDAPPLAGTIVEVRDIFYNTPGRRKFLKTNPTEFSHIIETVTQKALAYPEVGFSLRHNKSETLNVSSASSLKERFNQLYGEEYTKEFLELQSAGKIISITGFCSKPDVTRGSKSHQYIFVNRRPVKNPTINHGVYSAYRNIIPKDRHPAYFLFLEVAPQVVDVNVHPAKREVKFERPNDIHMVVEAAVFEALNPGYKKDALSHLSASEKKEGTTPVFEYSQHERIPDSSFISESLSAMPQATQSDFFAAGMTSDISEFFRIGEAFLARVTDRGLLLIDQHAAHERILFEKILRKTTIIPDPLFLPLRIELPPREYALIIQQKEVLLSLGLDIEDFGGNNIIIRALPKELRKADAKGLLLDIASDILEQETNGITADLTEQSLVEKIAARLACHKSVRGREPLNNAEITQMMSDLEKTDAPDRCPHGRPTKILLTLDELQKMFRRK